MVVRKAAVRARSFSSAALPRGPFGVSAETAMHFCGAFFRWSIMVGRNASFGLPPQAESCQVPL